ncbi:hypothetical protein OPKNFCMD_1428 [Methylobacterium crusticola]|uniref:Uncharacterized protein n=1 Tax=Methylobacterium crusticola TaxID=1697972 RepID=A0ABQ4QTQ4_9HYPH|nr:hypothetical protein [Methylobacterium crusticola]GJD48705.1 hypothetical protein OPKNFCMD_1428 [Methylobacterium crusticola]
MPTQVHLPASPLDPLKDARALHASIESLRHLLRLQSRQLDALERRLAPGRDPAATGAARLRDLKSSGRL